MSAFSSFSSVCIRAELLVSCLPSASKQYDVDSRLAVVNDASLLWANKKAAKTRETLRRRRSALLDYCTVKRLDSASLPAARCQQRASFEAKTDLDLEFALAAFFVVIISVHCSIWREINRYIREETRFGSRNSTSPPSND